MASGWVIVSLDETSIENNDHRSYGWIRKSRTSNVNYRSEYSGKTLIAAVTSDGKSVGAILEGTNNSSTYLWFLLKLTRWLDKNYEDWRRMCVIIHDGCPVHHSPLIRKALFDLRYSMAWTAPASFTISAIEFRFGAWKHQRLTDLNNID